MQKYNTFYFYVLLLAGVYNLLWGAWVVLFPELSFTLHQMQVPTYPQIWQCVGMIVGVYGIGYIAAASDPIKHWPIVLVGFLGKVFGPIGFVYSLYLGVFPLSFMINIVFNDLIWWIPFFLILKDAYKQHNQTSSKADLHKLNFASKSIIVALRHQGCTFSRENLEHLNQYIDYYKKSGYRVYLLHMSENQEIQPLVDKYIQSSIELLSDPHREIYQALNLAKANFATAFGLKEFIQGLKGILKGYGLGPLRGDGFQLGGLFVVEDNQVKQSYPATRASDIYPYDKLKLS